MPMLMQGRTRIDRQPQIRRTDVRVRMHAETEPSILCCCGMSGAGRARHTQGQRRQSSREKAHKSSADVGVEVNDQVLLPPTRWLGAGFRARWPFFPVAAKTAAMSGKLRVGLTTPAGASQAAVTTLQLWWRSRRAGCIVKMIIRGSSVRL